MEWTSLAGTFIASVVALIGPVVNAGAATRLRNRITANVDLVQKMKTELTLKSSVEVLNKTINRQVQRLCELEDRKVRRRRLEWGDAWPAFAWVVIFGAIAGLVWWLAGGNIWVNIVAGILTLLTLGVAGVAVSWLLGYRTDNK